MGTLSNVKTSENQNNQNFGNFFHPFHSGALQLAVMLVD